MSNLVERLRLLIVLDEVGSNNPLGREAADEIERLTTLLADYEDSHRMTIDNCGAPDERHCSCVPSLRLEIKRLIAERDQAETAVSRYENTINERDRELVEARAERDKLAEKLAYVTQTLAPLVDDDNCPVESLARHAVADLAEARAEIQTLGKRELDYKELYLEARGLLRQVGGEDWHHHAGCSSNANSIDDCDCMPGMARAFLARTEGK